MAYNPATGTVSYELEATLSNGLVRYDEAPWTCNPVELTTACAPKGDGVCDGYNETYDGWCQCTCHDDLPSSLQTVADVQRWHERLWAVQPGEFSQKWVDNNLASL